MIPDKLPLVTLLRLLSQAPDPKPNPAKRGRGQINFYPDRLFIMGAVVMLVKDVHSVNGLLTMLQEPTAEMQSVRHLLHFGSHFPSQRTWDRRGAAIVEQLPELIASLGQHLLDLLQPWLTQGPAVAVDSTALRARGGVWHKAQREAGVVPHTSIDTEAAWSKSGWHGWWYGWKLHLVVTAGHCWLPLAADLTPANEPDGKVAEELLPLMASGPRYVLGDSHYQTEAVAKLCEQAGQTLVTSRGKRKRKADDPGREVRRELHKLRSATIENWNEQYKSLFDVHGSVPTKGLRATKRFALGGVLLYQLLLWYRYLHGLDLRRGFKSFLKAL